MEIVFQNPGFLPFLLLAAAPLILHLFARARPPVYMFSSNSLLRKILKYRMRLKKPRDMILLAVRTLLFFSLVMLFLLPLLFMNSNFAAPFEKKTVLIIVDATASTSYLEGGQTRFAAGCAEASEIISGLGSGDRANVIWLKYQSSAVYPAPGPNMNFLQQELRRASVTAETSDISSAVSLAVGMLEKAEGRRQICVISDFQASEWGEIAVKIPKTVDVMTISTGKTAASNQSVARVFSRPASPVIGEDLTLFCEIRNFSPEPRQCTVYLKTSEIRHEKEISIPAWGSAVPGFKCSFKNSGIVPYKFEIGEDLFPDDNSRWGILNVRKFISAGVAAGDEKNRSCWYKALKSIGWIKTDTVDIDTIGKSQADIVFLSAWNGENPEALASCIGAGHNVVCCPADGADLAKFFSILVPGSAPRDTKFALESSKKPRKMKLARQDAEIFSLFATGEFGDPLKGNFMTRLNFPPLALPPTGDVLLEYDDGIPALASYRHGRGVFYFWNIFLGEERSDWASSPQFVPFMGELVMNVGRDPLDLPEKTSFSPGQKMVFDLKGDESAEDLSLAGEDEKILPVHQILSADKRFFVSDPAEECGLYTWKHRDSTLGYSTVDFVPIESDLRTLPEQTIAKIGAISSSGGGGIRDFVHGIEVWPYFLLLAVLLILLEGSVALWMEKT